MVSKHVISKAPIYVGKNNLILRVLLYEVFIETINPRHLVI